MSGLVLVRRPCKLKLYSTHGRGIPLNKSSSVSLGQNLSGRVMSFPETGYGFLVSAKLIGTSMVHISNRVME